jgi:hypothetical protein
MVFLARAPSSPRGASSRSDGDEAARRTGICQKLGRGGLCWAPGGRRIRRGKSGGFHESGGQRQLPIALNDATIQRSCAAQTLQNI